jgi:hypothetical protein
MHAESALTPSSDGRYAKTKSCDKSEPESHINRVFPHGLILLLRAVSFFLVYNYNAENC